MTWSARAGASWLSITPANGQVTAGQSQRADVRVELRGLSAGNYSSTITITAPGAQGSPQQLTVQLRVSPAEATIYLTKPVPAPEGAILRLTGPNKVVQVAGNLESPGYIICGPDQRLYVQDFAGGGRILRYNQDGSGRKVIVQDPNLQITTFVFAPNGDLYFGTQKQGLWRLKGADPANKPEQILPPSTFTFMAEPYAFLTAGPRKGDLLILDSPWSGGRGVSNRVLVARAPDFKVAEPFITTTTYWPAGLALNSKSEIFVTMFYDGRIMRYAPDGSVQGTFSALQFANQIAIDSQDMVWVTNAVFRGDEVSGGLVRFKPNGSSEWMLDRVVLVRGVTVCE
jgi:sugar lactone lactonase YvrE